MVLTSIVRFPVINAQSYLRGVQVPHSFLSSLPSSNPDLQENLQRHKRARKSA
jgi:hypothetical protein